MIEPFSKRVGGVENISWLGSVAMDEGISSRTVIGPVGFEPLLTMLKVTVLRLDVESYVTARPATTGAEFTSRLVTVGAGVFAGAGAGTAVGVTSVVLLDGVVEGLLNEPPPLEPLLVAVVVVLEVKAAEVELAVVMALLFKSVQLA